VDWFGVPQLGLFECQCCVTGVGMWTGCVWLLVWRCGQSAEHGNVSVGCVRGGQCVCNGATGTGGLGK
jgi:hypothetical protein